MKYVPEKLIDYHMCIEDIRDDPTALHYVPRHLIDYNLCLASVKEQGMMIHEVPKYLINYALCETACFKSKFCTSWVLEHISNEFKDYKLCFQSLKINGYGFKMCSFKI